MTALTLAAANVIIANALSAAQKRDLKPLSVAVLDAGGHLIAFQKQDRASMLSFEIATGKAYGALALGFGSRWLEKASADRPHFVARAHRCVGREDRSRSWWSSGSRQSR